MMAILRLRSFSYEALGAFDQTVAAANFGPSQSERFQTEVFAPPCEHSPKNHRFWASLLLMATDAAAIGTIMFIGVWSAPSGQTIELPAMLACALIVGALSQTPGFYAVRSEYEVRRTAIGAIQVISLVAGLTAVVAAMLDGPMAAVGPLAAGVTGAICIALVRVVCIILLRRHILSLRERVLLVGTPEAVRNMGTAGGPLIIGCITLGADGHAGLGMAHLACIDLTPPADTGDDMVRFIDVLAVAGRRCDRVVVIGAGLDDAGIRQTLSCLEHMPLEISLAPSWTTFGETDSPLDHTACLRLRRCAMTTMERAEKRLFDIGLASLLVAALAPVFLLIAVAIKLESPGPALFRQRRWGWNNAPFTVLKFRTMRSGAAGWDGSVQAVRSDPRVTRVGALLRKTSLDELPQLLNVIGGSMSLVGPRPHPEALNRRFLTVIRYYAARHRVRPGITGWAQVNGCRGETRTAAHMQRRVELDLEYIRTRSFTFDLWILARTMVSVVSRTNAY